jgi:hypothetical protein
MKRVVFTICFLVIAISSLTGPAMAFNPATHLYIADRVLPACTSKADLFYGSIAPDMAQYADTVKWPNSFVDTHYTYASLVGYAWGPNQKAFAIGWFTHNELNGADYYAHGIWTGNGYSGGYVTTQAGILSMQLDIPEYFAHFAIEAAIDYLMKTEHDKTLGVKLLKANIFHSLSDAGLLTKVLVSKNKETDWFTLISAELNFRGAINQYAAALSLPAPFDKNALVELGVQLAEQQFGITVTPEQLMYIFDASIQLCHASNYYYYAVVPAIEGIKGILPH